MTEIKEFYTIVCPHENLGKKCAWKNKWKFTDLHHEIQKLLIMNEDSDAHVHTSCARCKKDIHFNVRDLV